MLTTGYESNVVTQEVHIPHQNGEFSQWNLVDNPIAIIFKNVQTKLTEKEVIVKMKISNYIFMLK